MASPKQARGCQNLAIFESLMFNSKYGCPPKKRTLGFVAPIYEKHLKHKIST